MKVLDWDELLRQLHAEAGDRLRPDDHARLHAIEAACDRDTPELAELVMAYYADFDRAQRTPAGFQQFHIGMLAVRLRRSYERASIQPLPR